MVSLIAVCARARRLPKSLHIYIRFGDLVNEIMHENKRKSLISCNLVFYHFHIEPVFF